MVVGRPLRLPRQAERYADDCRATAPVAAAGGAPALQFHLLTRPSDTHQRRNRRDLHRLNPLGIRTGGRRSVGASPSAHWRADAPSSPCSGVGSGGGAVAFRFLALAPPTPPPSPAPEVWAPTERRPPAMRTRG